MCHLFLLISDLFTYAVNSSLDTFILAAKFFPIFCDPIAHVSWIDKLYISVDKFPVKWQKHSFQYFVTQLLNCVTKFLELINFTFQMVNSLSNGRLQRQHSLENLALNQMCGHLVFSCMRLLPSAKSHTLVSVMWIISLCSSSCIYEMYFSSYWLS